MSWKPAKGWLLRSRSRTGSESKRKVGSYAEARREARSTIGMLEIWIEEADIVPRPWSDLEPRRKRRVNEDRQHFVSIEEEEK